MIVGQPPPPSSPPSYLVWGIMSSLSLIGAGIFVLVLPRDKPTRRTATTASATSSSDSNPRIPAAERDVIS
ncbi:MAG: hypothetical protein AUF79_08555 [Crenarchaeota archaeon 13_1_20CM_2_51_8]|nr:MAG: hypothetical protein AUF79_08555 [Crenarchaeota archaeon 13_1_20CM_2_51_8]